LLIFSSALVGDDGVSGGPAWWPGGGVVRNLLKPNCLLHWIRLTITN
jgi:hypothetical protein